MTRRVGRRRALGLIGAGLGTMVLAGAAPKRAPLPKARGATGQTSVFKAAPGGRATAAHGSSIAAKLDLSGNHGWMAVDLASGRTIESHQAGRAFAPASVAKLPTAFYGIDTLGPDFRFETVVAVNGPIRNGRLEGDIALIGGGDPELDTDAIVPLVERLAATGLRTVTGRFLIDAGIGPRIPELDPEQPDDVTYNPAISGLNLNFNRVRIQWDAKKGGGILTSALGERYDPPVDGIRVDIDPKPNAPVFDHGYAPGHEVWRMAQRAYRGKGSRWLPVRRPELYAAEVFRDYAREKGVMLPLPEEGALAGEARVLASHRGRPLTEVARSMLKYSTNLTAEAIGVRATAADGPPPVTLYHSARAMNDWAARLCGFAPNDPAFRFHNHSGLSSESRVSPERMMGLLRLIALRPPAGEADPRVPGALSGLLKTHNIREKNVSFDYDRTFVAAKTGTMNYVRGLAGYVSTPRGRKLAFAFFANDIARRDASGGRTNKSWIARAQVLERRLIRHWVTLADAG